MKLMIQIYQFLSTLILHYSVGPLLLVESFSGEIIFKQKSKKRFDYKSHIKSKEKLKSVFHFKEYGV